MHTSTYQHRHRVIFNNTPLDARFTNWALELREHGHSPALFGYTDTVLDPRTRATSVSEDALREGVLPGLTPIVELGKTLTAVEPWVEWLRDKRYSVPDVGADLYREKKYSSDWEDGADMPNPLKVPAELHDTFFMADQVLDYIRDREGWCVHLSLLRPHPPWTAPEPYNAIYAPEELADFVQPNSFSEECANHPFLNHALKQVEAFLQAPDGERRLLRLKAAYFGLMSEVDANLGRIFAALKASGAWDKTLIIFTSDHGEQIGDHHLIGKLGFYDQSYHVPLIVRNPDADAFTATDSIVDGFVEGVDIAPTILDWLDVDIPDQFVGGSLIPATKTGFLPEDWRDEAHWEFDFGYGLNEGSLNVQADRANLTVIRSKNTKYVHFPSLPPLLYDLENDPEESRNLAEAESHRDLLDEMRDKMLTWRIENDELPLVAM